ncbi:hypothetical protein [Thalassospira alkalitolerans]|uniref:hypothetical protein n=1 Tax=Thalassospira alkalitolerans TaxID=1293890 RepID=UPI0030ECE18F
MSLTIGSSQFFQGVGWQSDTMQTGSVQFKGKDNTRRQVRYMAGAAKVAIKKPDFIDGIVGVRLDLNHGQWNEFVFLVAVKYRFWV